jgi:hypothetical protein
MQQWSQIPKEDYKTTIQALIKGRLRDQQLRIWHERNPK